MFYRQKQIILFVLFLMLNAALVSQEGIGFYCDINQVTGLEETDLLIRDSEGAVKKRSKGEKVFPGEKIFTSEKQKAELIVYKENIPVAMLFLGEKTDVECVVNGEELSFFVTIGKVRVVATDRYKLPLKLNRINISGTLADYGFVSSIDEETGRYKGYVIVFGGEVEASSADSYVSAPTYTKASFTAGTFTVQDYFTRKDLLLWQETMTTDSEFIPSGFHLVLENLDSFSIYQYIVQKEQEEEARLSDAQAEVDVTDDYADDATSDKSNAGDNVKRFFLSMLNLEAGGAYYKNDIDINDTSTYFDYNKFAAKFAMRPGLSLLNDNVEFRFNLVFYMLPTHFLIMRPFMNVNDDNNEWSMGTDHQGQVHRIVFDVFNDLFLKVHLIRYGFEGNPVFIKAGDIYNIDDDYSFCMQSFNSSIFAPIKRSTGFLTKIKLRFFESTIYAEDVLPKGIYGASAGFFTPSRSFQIKGGVSAYFDLYDFRQYIYGNLTEEIFVPGIFAGNLKFTVFDVPSFGLDLYWNGGVLVPFSYNAAEGTFSFNEMITANPSAMGSCLAFNSGVSTRFRRVTLTGEVTVDSDINKVGLFDTLYIARRLNRNTIYSNWLSDMNDRTPGIGDILFGARVQILYEKEKNVYFKMQYQIGATYDDSQIIPVGLYDKFSFILRLDSIDKWKVNVASDIEFHVEEIGLRIYDMAVNQNFSNLFRSFVLYYGLHITPRPGFTIHTRFGMYPGFLDQTSSFKVLLESYISYNPEFDFKVFRKKSP